MFEKDAIDLANRKYPIPRVYNELNVARNRKYEEGFKDGAEFGYNKRNKQLIKAKEIICEHMTVLHKCAELLLEKEKISRDEFEALFDAEGVAEEVFVED